jgi:metal-responsive CopG/Arc/MetJ family transcriptional regulator
MRATKTERMNTKGKSSPRVRASISFPNDLYHALEELSKQKKVSLAWVVRDAAERYVAAEQADALKGSK